MVEPLYQTEAMISVNIPKASTSLELEKQDIKETMQNMGTAFNIMKSDSMLQSCYHENGLSCRD